MRRRAGPGRDGVERQSERGTVGYAKAEQLTLKTFRSSMATQLARDGKKIEIILAAGEWAGAACMNYMKLQEIDESALLLQAFAVSDEEGDM